MTVQAQETKMRYPDGTPYIFEHVRTFVEQHGHKVWSELCDAMPADTWFSVGAAAGQLPSLAGQDDPEHCLKAVLCAILADYTDRPDDYEHQSPVAFGDYEFNTACI